MDISFQQFFSIVWPTALASAIILFLLDHYKNVYSFWPKHGVKGDQPMFPIVWDLWKIFSTCQMKLSLERTRKYGKIYGTSFLGRKRLVINDPEIINQIAVKDFDKFPDHTLNEWTNGYLRNSLLWIQGDHWKRVRALMSPSFSSGKIKRMFKLLDGCADDLVESFRDQYIKARRNGEPCAVVDLQDTFGMYTMDGISTCCYGIKLKREQLREAKLLRNKRQANLRDSFIRDLNAYIKINIRRTLALVLVPKFILRRLKFSLISEASLEPIVGRVQKMIDLRREGVDRKYDDLLQLLVNAKIDDKIEHSEVEQVENHHAGLTKQLIEEDQLRLQDSLRQKATLSDFEILSEALLLLAAGLETTRSLLASITYFLAHNLHIQDRLVRELKEIAGYTPTVLGKHLVFDYDALTSCQYLDAVVSETLRMFPPTIYTDRYAKQEYHIKKYNITIPRDVQVLFGLYSVHMDPDYWEEPERFNPDRFMPGQREKIVPGSYVPFSIGPRHCIGMRFSLAETKLGLAKLLMSFRFEPAPNTLYPPRSARSFGLINMHNCKVRVLLREE